jgi:hypothetical protein
MFAQMRRLPERYQELLSHLALSNMSETRLDALQKVLLSPKPLAVVKLLHGRPGTMQMET